MAFVKLADNYTDLIGKFAVALLAEGVDRNRNTPRDCPSKQVALLAEGVDRNFTVFVTTEGLTTVALLAEGVDRNPSPRTWLKRVLESPSSRRAWIEIKKTP